MNRIMIFVYLFVAQGVIGQVALDENLLLRYSFNNDVDDLIGDELSSSTAELSEGRNGASDKSMAFDGSSEMVFNGSDELNDLTKNFSFSFWIYPEDSTTRQGIIDKWGDGPGLTADDQFIIHLDNGKLKFDLSSNSRGTSTDSINYNEWNHYVLTYDTVSYRAKIYHNGEKVAESPEYPGYNLRHTDYRLAIGSHHGGNHYTGKMDDLSVYDKVLNEEEIAALYNYDYVLSTSSDFNQTNQVAVFPNPCTSTLTLAGMNQNENWEVIGTDGSFIEKGQGNNINVQNYPKGMYLLKLDHEVLKFVKE